MKTNWKDASPLRKPNGTWQTGRAARWFEELLGISQGSVRFFRPNGTEAQAKETIGSLRPEARQKRLSSLAGKIKGDPELSSRKGYSRS